MRLLLWMPFAMKSCNDARLRTVKKRLADGTVKIYTYSVERRPRHGRHAPDSIGALLVAYRRSPEWQEKASATILGYNQYLRQLERLEHLPVRAIKRREIIKIRDALALRSGNGAANLFVRVSSAMFGWALEREWIDFNPASRIRSLKGGSLKAWTVEQAEHAMETMEEPLRRVILLAMYTGQRRTDLCRLTWAAYDGSTIRLTQSKTKVKLVIPVHPRLAAELDEWKRLAKSVHILTTLTGRNWDPAYMTMRFMRHIEAAGLPTGLNVHGLRKLAATLLAQAGCSTHEIASITGHKTLAMVQHYTDSVSQEKLAGAAILRMQTGSANRRKTGI